MTIKHFKYLIINTLLLLITQKTIAQIPSWTPPKGKFLSDSVKVGLPVQYALSYRHKATADVFFPDSTYNFSPFELVKREYFNTVTDQNGSLDSVVYTLISFEVTPIQELSLPVYVRAKQDCTRVFAPMSYVILNSIIKSNVNIDSLSLKKDTRLIPIAQQVNFPLIFLIIIGLLLVIGMIFWFFGKPIRRQVRLFNFKRRYDDFRKLFQRLSRGTEDAKKRLENIEKAVVLWKKYIERIENKPFTTFTTKEILDNLKDNRLSDALREIDATVYGGVYSNKTIASLQVLQELAEGLYRERRVELGIG
ncbi:MAG: hypothetical protein RLZZ306_2960 [Bacteroidota bacterium]|jgi:hypothetical protein